MATAAKFAFDGKNAEAVKRAQKMAARAVTRVSKETKAGIRALIARAIREGIPPYDAARMIRSMVGMTAPQAMAAMNHREFLINSGLTLDKVEALMDKYVEKKIRERAIMIARTEIMDALNDGAEESWKQAQEDGFLSDTATKEVIITGDAQRPPCDICENLDGVTAPIDGMFESSDGSFDNPPFHPMCRCAIAVNP